MSECDGGCCESGPCCICGLPPEEAKKVMEERGIKFPLNIVKIIEKS